MPLLSGFVAQGTMENKLPFGRWESYCMTWYVETSLMKTTKPSVMPKYDSVLGLPMSVRTSLEGALRSDRVIVHPLKTY
jgi:hypothetical protein